MDSPPKGGDNDRIARENNTMDPFSVVHLMKHFYPVDHKGRRYVRRGYRAFIGNRKIDFLLKDIPSNLLTQISVYKIQEN